MWWAGRRRFSFIEALQQLTLCLALERRIQRLAILQLTRLRHLRCKLATGVFDDSIRP